MNARGELIRQRWEDRRVDVFVPYIGWRRMTRLATLVIMRQFMRTKKPSKRVRVADPREREIIEKGKLWPAA